MRGPLDDLDEIIATAKELDAAILLLPLAYGEGGPGRGPGRAEGP